MARTAKAAVTVRLSYTAATDASIPLVEDLLSELAALLTKPSRSGFPRLDCRRERKGRTFRLIVTLKDADAFERFDDVFTASRPVAALHAFLFDPEGGPLCSWHEGDPFTVEGLER